MELRIGVRIPAREPCYTFLMQSWLARFDRRLINFFQTAHFPVARAAIFVVYFWFGILKVTGASPANSLVAGLLEKTLPFITFQQFIVAFGWFEMALGLFFLWPKLDRLSIFLFGVHMVTTLMPLFLLPAVAWQAWFVPTLEGQYIIKNLVLMALVIDIAANVKPWRKD